MPLLIFIFCHRCFHLGCFLLLVPWLTFMSTIIAAASAAIALAQEQAAKAKAQALLGRRAYRLCQGMGTQRSASMRNDIGFKKLDEALLKACKDRNVRPGAAFVICAIVDPHIVMAAVATLGVSCYSCHC